MGRNRKNGAVDAEKIEREFSEVILENRMN
jgi:hypothetical protein